MNAVRRIGAFVLILCFAFAGSGQSQAATIRYGNDAAGRLTSADYGTSGIVYTYDASGNLTSLQAGAGRQPRLLADRRRRRLPDAGHFPEHQRSRGEFDPELPRQHRAAHCHRPEPGRSACGRREAHAMR